PQAPKEPPHFSGKLTQKQFFKVVEKHLQPNDVLIAEMGTSFFGAVDVHLPKGASFIGQPLWGSIGYTFGALLGSALADRKRRNVLLEGDGSFQLTAQELSTMLREDIKPIIVLVNNDGYTVERCIHGPERKYNDINMWHYTKLVEAFDVHLHRKPLTFKVDTAESLSHAFEQAYKHPDKLAFIEVEMARDDAPALLKKLGALFSAQNSY
uniref:thiamine pyrophosphate-dependent enzyme n=2 Tax=Helicobacter heilmannii TaxID=35817 RepID=UPI001F42E768